jgi:hypothetical protein
MKRVGVKYSIIAFYPAIMPYFAPGSGGAPDYFGFSPI